MLINRLAPEEGPLRDGACRGPGPGPRPVPGPCPGPRAGRARQRFPRARRRARPAVPARRPARPPGRPRAGPVAVLDDERVVVDDAREVRLAADHGPVDLDGDVRDAEAARRRDGVRRDAASVLAPARRRLSSRSIDKFKISPLATAPPSRPEI